jgi:hypothetical protein
MANTSISITWVDADANTTDTYTHDLSQANYLRVLDYFRDLYKGPDPDSVEEAPPIIPASKNKARKLSTKDTIQNWKDLARGREVRLAEAAALANVAVPPLDSTET